MKKDIPKSKIQILESQLKELTEALQRERADAINLRRRAEEERLQSANFHKSMVVRELLPIIDNGERLLDHISVHSKEAPWKEGAKKIVQQSYNVLADLGVERIKTVGEHFDPHLHEAIHMDDSSTGSGQAADDTVSEELQPGYKLGDEVIRHAIVKVKKVKKEKSK